MDAKNQKRTHLLALTHAWYLSGGAFWRATIDTKKEPAKRSSNLDNRTKKKRAKKKRTSFSVTRVTLHQGVPLRLEDSLGQLVAGVSVK